MVYDKDKLEGFDFLTTRQVLQRALAQESRAIESRDTHRMNQGHVNIVEYQNNSDDEVDVHIIELVWPSVKPYTCSDLKAVRKKTR
jgi:hypothetical protein